MLRRDQDSSDPYIPLLIWWAVEAKAATHREQILQKMDDTSLWRHELVRTTLIPRLARRYAAEGDDAGFEACAQILAMAPKSEDVERVIGGMEEQLQERARRLGRRFLQGLADLAAQHEIIGDVRGQGLFLGLELIRDRVALEPADREAADLVERMKERGFLLSTDGPDHNVVKIKPPTVLTVDDVDQTLDALDRSLGELA